MRSNIGKVCRAQCEFFLQPGLLVFISLSYMLVYCHLFSLVLPVYCYQPISLHPHACMLRHVTLWTAACQAPLSMDFPRQESWGGLPFPSPGDLPHKIKPSSPTLAGGFITTVPPGKPVILLSYLFNVAENWETRLKVNSAHSFVHYISNHQMISVEVGAVKK